MQVVSQSSELQAGGQPLCLAIGVFDGVHLGHQAVIGRAVEEARRTHAKPAVITFDRHPNAVVAPERVPLSIASLNHRLAIFESLGVESCWIIPFDETFSRQSAEDFVRGLAAAASPIASISVGSTFNFGYRRGGDIGLLEKLGSQLGFSAHGLAPVTAAGLTISSTRIRETIASGDLVMASAMLGRPYSVRGMVVEGDHLGQKLGFPTANLDVAGLVLPPTGVYAARACWLGKTRQAVVNLGNRPTLAQPAPRLRLEAHLLDFQGDLYGKELEVVFVGKLREERKFANLEALKEQIAADIREAGKRLR